MGNGEASRTERLTVEEAAEELGCSREHLYQLMKRREIGYIQLAGQKRALLRGHITAYLARRENPAKGEERIIHPLRSPFAPFPKPQYHGTMAGQIHKSGPAMLATSGTATPKELSSMPIHDSAYLRPFLNYVRPA